MLDAARRRHQQALTAAFDFAAATDFSWKDGAAESYANQVRIVLDCIAQGVPFGTEPDELILFFVHRTWPIRGQTMTLWQAYVKAGYIDTESRIQMHCKKGPLLRKAKSGFVSLLPLEMAIAVGNVQGARALLAAGANPQAVPSQPWKDSKKPMDIFGFIKHVTRGDASELRSVAAQALGAHPLEQAVFNGDVDSFRNLVDMGASISKVPSRTWQPGVKKAMDAKGFIKFACPDADKRHQFEALATAAMMAEKIRSAEKPATKPARTEAHPAPATNEVSRVALAASTDATSESDQAEAPVSRRRRVGI